MPAMARFQFSADYNHRWPSRAASFYRADGGPEGNGTYTVKREVVERAEKAGKGTWLDKPATAPANGALGKAVDGLAVRDPAAGRDDAPRDELEPPKRTRRRRRLSLPPSAG